MRKNVKQLAQAAQAQKTATATAAIMHVTPPAAEQDAPTAEQPTAPVDEAAEEVSPLSVATDQAPAEQPAVPVAEQPAPLAPAAEQPAAPAPMFTPLLVPQAPRPMEELLGIVVKAKSLTDRLTGLRATSEKLGSFEVGREGFTDRLTLRDGNGEEWNTTQGVVIQKVLDVLRGELRGSINTTEAELRTLLQAA